MKRTPKNFAIWTALNYDIHFFASSPSYYGGVTTNNEQKAQLESFCKKHNISKQSCWRFYSDSEIITKIKTIGIDWDSCPMPKSDRVAEFNGTEADSSWNEIVVGKLFLIDGEVIDYYAECSLNIGQFSAMQLFFDQSIKE